MVNPLHDDELLAGLRRQDPAALTALIDAYLPPVYALCVRILAGAGSPQDAEECASDAFHAAWRQVGHYDPSRAPLRTWLLMLAKYVALERRRQNVRRAEVEGPAQIPVGQSATEPLPQEQLASGEERARLQTALQSLPTLDRVVVYRRYFLGESTRTLAESLGLSPQAVDNRLWRSRRQLRIALRQIDDGQKEVRRR